MKLSTLAILLGLGFGMPLIYGVLKPGEFRDAVRKFARSEPWGYALMSLGTAWFLWNLNRENLSDFAAYKPAMLVGFGAVGVATCIFVRDFLAVRGLAIVWLLLAKLMVDTARWVDTEWRLVMVTWAYGLVVAGIWFTVSPWRLRDLIEWVTRTDLRIRVVCGVRLAFGLFIAILGLTVFRTVERRVEPSHSARAPAAIHQAEPGGWSGPRHGEPSMRVNHRRPDPRCRPHPAALASSDGARGSIRPVRGLWLGLPRGRNHPGSIFL